MSSVESSENERVNWDYETKRWPTIYRVIE